MRILFIGALAGFVFISGCAAVHKPPVSELATLKTQYFSPPETSLTSPSVGLAFSGGGSRSLSATMGQMRGLRILNLLEESKFISSVSGGAWASTLYTYLPNEISDDDFLGAVIAPEDLSWPFFSCSSEPGSLSYLPPHNMGTVPQRMGILDNIGELIELREKYGYPSNQFWTRLIGQRIFEPFGLSSVDENGKPTHFYSSDEDYVKTNIIKNNQNLKLSDFHLVRKNRPSLIVNTSMFATNDPNAELLPVESTSEGVGIRGTFLGKGIKKKDIGGGLVQAFAFGGADQQSTADNLAQVTSTQRFSLSDIAGLSSAAFAETIEVKFPEFDGLLPKYDYWPVANAFEPKNKATKYWFADGGNLANTGVIPLLARKVPVIISFVNTPDALEQLSVANGKTVIKVDASLPPLFGYMPLGDSKFYKKYPAPNMICNEVKLDCYVSKSDQAFAGNRVFKDTENNQAFEKFTQGLWKAKSAGGPVIFVQDLDVVPNSKFNVSGENAQKVKMVWVYNSKVENWWHKLPRELRAKLDLDPLQFHDFPHYKTILQLKLSPAQVNLLAHLSAWNITQDEYIIPSAGKTSKALFESLYND